MIGEEQINANFNHNRKLTDAWCMKEQLVYPRRSSNSGGAQQRGWVHPLSNA